MTRFSLRRLHHSAFPPERLAAERELSVSICLPARDEVQTIGPVLERLMPLLDLGAVDQVIVLDDSTDGTADVARRLGAEVHDQSSLLPAFGPVAGKGDAMWRALAVATGDVVCYLDADSDPESFGAHYASGLAGPLATGGPLVFSKAFYRRPFRQGAVVSPTGGGRVTELIALPLLRRLFPALAEFHQPLAGEIAVRRSLLERLPFRSGYGVDVALLIDAWREVGIGAMCQVDLDVRQNRHRPLEELGPMADAVLDAVLNRVAADGRLTPDLAAPAVHAVERPPYAAVRAAAHVI